MECIYVTIDAVFGGKDAKVVNMKSIFSYDFVDYAHCMNYYSFYIFCSKIVLDLVVHMDILFCAYDNANHRMIE